MSSLEKHSVVSEIMKFLPNRLAIRCFLGYAGRSKEGLFFMADILHAELSADSDPDELQGLLRATVRIEFGSNSPSSVPSDPRSTWVDFSQHVWKTGLGRKSPRQVVQYGLEQALDNWEDAPGGLGRGVAAYLGETPLAEWVSAYEFMGICAYPDRIVASAEWERPTFLPYFGMVAASLRAAYDTSGLAASCGHTHELQDRVELLQGLTKRLDSFVFKCAQYNYNTRR